MVADRSVVSGRGLINTDNVHVLSCLQFEQVYFEECEYYVHTTSVCVHRCSVSQAQAGMSGSSIS